MELLCSTTQLMNEMDATHELEALAAKSPALARFRECCSEALSVKLVELRMRRQSQQDVHEFLLQLVEALSRSTQTGEGGEGDGQSHRPVTRNEAAQGARVAGRGAPITDQLRCDLARAHAEADADAVEALLQSISPSRKGGHKSPGAAPAASLAVLQHYFMGLRCATMECKSCGANGDTRCAEFITEEVGLVRPLRRRFPARASTGARG